MHQKRWLRIIPVALIMYTISYVDRTNVSLALDPTISSMLRDLAMDDRMKGEVAGIFFFGYVLLQVPAGDWAACWSPRKLISLFLIAWGACAIGCGLASTFRQFELMRFLLGVAESGVFPATLVLLANWFPNDERARATAYWTLCQPVAITASAPITGWLLGAYGWQRMLIFEGLLPFAWLPIWWFGISDSPREANWLSTQEREYLETNLQARGERSPSLPKEESAGEWRQNPTSGLPQSAEVPLVLMILIYFIQNCQAYGCMTFFTTALKGRGFTALQNGLLFAVPYAVAAIIMVLVSRNSDRTGERRGHVGAVYLLSGFSLILSVALRQNFWLSYALLCLAIPGPFAAMGPFWAIPGETLPRQRLGLIVGLVNAVGNLGGFAGPYIVGWLKKESGGVTLPFAMLGIAMVIAAGMALLLPASSQQRENEVLGKLKETIRE